MTYSGPQAHPAFAGLPGPRDELCHQVGLTDGRRMCGYIGVAGGRQAFVYRCDTHDGRALSVGHPGIAPALFRASLDELDQLQSSGQLAHCDPPLDTFRYRVRKRFKT